MALQENTMFGEKDKVRIAIERIQSFEYAAKQLHENGYYVAISGGKDSSTIQQLCIISGVKCEFVHNHTTVDHPETVKFMHKEKERIQKLGYKFSISYPKNSKGERISMWSEIAKKGFPTRITRWCCELFKEHGGENRFVITGIRWAESNKRKSRGIYETFSRKKENRVILNNDNDIKRKLTENCIKQGKMLLNPIIDWEDDDIWEFIKRYDLPYNPLYDKGHRRVGCIGCPCRNNYNELESNPALKKMYFNAGKKFLEQRVENGKENNGAWSTPETYYLWWTEQLKNTSKNDYQISFKE